MVSISVSADSTKVTIVGHGLKVNNRFELSEGIYLSSRINPLDIEKTAEGCRHFSDYAATLNGNEIASFLVEIEDVRGGKALASKAWNSLWLFHLLSVACRSPCFLLYSESDGEKPRFSATTRNPFVYPLQKIHIASSDQLEWAKKYKNTFDELILNPEFSSAMRCYGNSHYLPDNAVRIMLLWAGIEGLLSVDGELNRRLALYSALMLNGSAEDKIEYFEYVKKSYALRSRAVHGGNIKPKKLEQGYESASEILIGLLARCVEIGRVPKPAELDQLAVSAIVS